MKSHLRLFAEMTRFYNCRVQCMKCYCVALCLSLYYSLHLKIEFRSLNLLHTCIFLQNTKKNGFYVWMNSCSNVMHYCLYRIERKEIELKIKIQFFFSKPAKTTLLHLKFEEKNWYILLLHILLAFKTTVISNCRKSCLWRQHFLQSGKIFASDYFILEFNNFRS